MKNVCISKYLADFVFLFFVCIQTNPNAYMYGMWLLDKAAFVGPICEGP